MARNWLIILGVVLFVWPRVAEAQHFHGMSGSYESTPPWSFNPGHGHSGHIEHFGHSGPGYGRSFSYQVGRPGLYGFGTYGTQPAQVASYAIPDNTVPNIVPMPLTVDPTKIPITPSTPAARLRSLEHQARGDQRLREQKWSEARAAYRSSVDAAPDRAEGHLRLGLSLVAIQRFEPAIREFKRALFIDPMIPQMGKVSAALFGPDSQIVRSSIISKVSDWVRDDVRDPNRLFLLGVILHFEGDARGREVRFFPAALFKMMM